MHAVETAQAGARSLKLHSGFSAQDVSVHVLVLQLLLSWSILSTVWATASPNSAAASVATSKQLLHHSQLSNERLYQEQGHPHQRHSSRRRLLACSNYLGASTKCCLDTGDCAGGNCQGNGWNQVG